MLDLVQLPGYENRSPKQLSGGQQQRIALARALIFDPPVLLMDEPLGALDKKLREHMQLEIKHIQSQLKRTVIYVTHDQEEAMVLSDEVMVMDLGKVIQRGGPEEIYFNPTIEFVADFIGKINFFNGTVKSQDNELYTVSIREENFQDEIYTTHAEFAEGNSVLASVRPENIHIHTSKPEQTINTWSARLERKNFLGGLFDMVVTIRGKELRCRSPFVIDAHSGSDVYIHIKPEDVLWIEA